jgi:hypothetical protein
MSARGAAGSAMGAAREAGTSDGLENLARVGLIAYGVVHVLVAWLALQLAWGGGGRSADQSGAMATLAEQPFGKPLLWVLALGLIALAVWQAAEVLRWRSGWSASGKTRTKALKKSGGSLVKAAIYILVAAAGLILIGIGVWHVYKGISRRFLKQIDLAEAPPAATRLVTRLGQVGFPAKGVALALVGGLLGYAATTFDPSKAQGLDGALRTVLQAPFGRILLTLVAVGIAAFGAFCFVRARYPERT